MSIDTAGQEISIDADLVSVREACGFVNACARRAGLSDETAAELELAVDEICTNIVMHGYQSREGRIALSVDCGQDAVRVTIMDSAGPFDPLGFTPPDVRVPLPEREVGCLGILIARNMVDGISYDRAEEKNKTILTKLIQTASVLKND